MQIAFPQHPRRPVLACCLDWYYNLLQQSYPFCKDEEERTVGAV